MSIAQANGTNLAYITSLLPSPKIGQYPKTVRGGGLRLLRLGSIEERKTMCQLPDSASPIIAFENVSFNHAGRELHGISFAAYAGRVTVLMGAHDAGKTTVLRMLLGLDIPDSGCISTCGKPYGTSRIPKNVVSAMPEAISLSPYYSAGTYLRWKALWAGTPDPLLDGIIHMTELQNLLTVKLHDLAPIDVLKMRFAIALLPNPKALIMDEPLQTLDRSGTNWICEQIRKQANRGVAVLIASEPDSRLRPITDDVVVLDKGTVVKEGSRGQLWKED